MKKKKYPEGLQKIGDIDIISTLAALNRSGNIYRIMDLIQKHLLVANCDCHFITKEKDIKIGLIVLLYIAIEMDVKIDRAEHICALCNFFHTCSFPKRN